MLYPEDMAIKITRREVFNNLIRFKDNLLVKGEHRSSHSPQKRLYIALLNRHTGEIRFAQKFAVPQGQFSAAVKEGAFADWQEIHLVAEDAQDIVHFHLAGPRGSSLKPVESDALAICILFETLDVLNQLASQYHPISETLPEYTVLEHLSDLHMFPIEEPIESMRGWSEQIDRIEAEKQLFGRPEGTYLLRRGDELTGQVAKAFSEANKMSVKLYILTFVEGTQKISDRLLILGQWGWTIAQDEPDLSSAIYEYHATLHALLGSLKYLINVPF
jgi:hypothetical protein